MGMNLMMKIPSDNGDAFDDGDSFDNGDAI
jgi:hypothetical protein